MLLKAFLCLPLTVGSVGVMVMMPDLESVGCEFKYSTGIFSFLGDQEKHVKNKWVECLNVWLKIFCHEICDRKTTVNLCTPNIYQYIGWKLWNLHIMFVDVLWTKTVKPISINTREPEQGTASSFTLQMEVENNLDILTTVKLSWKVS